MTVPFAGRQALLDRSGALSVPSLGIICASLDSNAMDQGSLFEEVDPLQPLREAHGRLGGDIAVLLITGHRPCEVPIWPGIERLICVAPTGLERFESDGIFFSVKAPLDGEPSVFAALLGGDSGPGFLISQQSIGVPSLNGPHDLANEWEPEMRFVPLSEVV